MPDRKPPGDVAHVRIGEKTGEVTVTIGAIGEPWSWACPQCGAQVVAPPTRLGEVRCPACRAWWSIHTVEIARA